MSAPVARMPGFPVVIRFPLHWGEMDALGHANNARFFAWMESARIAYFERLGVIGGMGGTGGLSGLYGSIGPILASAECEFLQPVVYPAELIVGAGVAEVGNSSLRMDYAVARAETPEAPSARGRAVVVLVDYKSLAKVRVPDGIRAAISLIEGR